MRFKRKGLMAASAAIVMAAAGLVLLTTRSDFDDVDESYPNILFLIADDLGVDWGPCFAEHDLMPNVERLCDNGVVFDRTYSTPSCAPTRATLLTGRYALRTRAGATRRHRPDDPPNRNLSLEEIIIPEVLDQIEGGNYRHAAFGKWHLSDTFNGGLRNPLLAGFQNYWGTFSFADYFKWPRHDNGKRGGEVRKYKTTAFVDDAISWIDDTGNRPWFAWVAFYNPHSPWHLPPLYLHDFDHLDPNPDFASAKDDPSYAHAYFSAMLQALDTEIGRLLHFVESAVERDTYIVFIGDNGTSKGVAVPDFGRNRFKSTIWEGGIHVPLVVSGPDIVEPGRRVSALVNSTDLFATVIELAQGRSVLEQSPVALDSISLVPYLRDRRTPALREWAFVDTGNQHRKFRHAVIEGTYKLIVQSESLRLYDLENDPYERRQLINEKMSDRHARRARQLFSRFVDLYQSEDDPYTDVKIENLIAAYQNMLCREFEEAEASGSPSPLPCPSL